MIISHRAKKRGPDGDELTFEEMSRDYRLIINKNMINQLLARFFFSIDVQQ
jgi:hypothetical protein